MLPRVQNLQMSIGPTIRRLRKERGWTLQDLVDRVGSDTGNLSRIERGRHSPSDTLTQRIAKALGTTVSELYRLSESADGIGREGQIPVLEHDSILPWVRGADSAAKIAEYVHIHGNYGPHTFAVRVVGDHMLELFSDGDLIAVDPDAPVDSGDFALIYLPETDQIIFREFHRVGRSVLLVARNPRFPNDRLEEPHEILGRVIRKLERRF